MVQTVKTKRCVRPEAVDLVSSEPDSAWARFEAAADDSRQHPLARRNFKLLAHGLTS